MGHTPSSSAKSAVQISAAYLGEDVGSLSSVMFKNTRTMAPSVGRTGRCGLLRHREGERVLGARKAERCLRLWGLKPCRTCQPGGSGTGIRSAGALPSAGGSGRCGLTQG